MILYVGNYISKHGTTPTFNEFLSDKLGETYKVYKSSDQKNKYLRMIAMLWSVFKYSHKVKVVMVDSFSTQAFWFAFGVALMCRINRIPYVPIIRGGMFEERLKRNPRLSRWILKNSAANLSPSHFMEDILKSKGFSVTYIPNYLDVKNYEFLKRDKFELKLLWVRSLHEVYNPVLAVDILHTLKQKHKNVTLCMIGPDKDGSKKQIEDQAVKLNVQDSITLTGKMNKDEWRLESKNYDIFINTTNVDNQPLTVTEAMALGLPVISTAIGGNKYFIKEGQNGFLVPVGDKDAFVEKIEYILNNQEKVKTICMNARHDAEQFEWDKVKPLYDSLFAQIMKK